MLGRAFDSARDFWRRKGPKSLTERLIVYGSFLIIPAIFVYSIAFAPDETDVYPDTPDVTYENRAGIFVRVFVDGYYQASLDAGDSKTDRYFYCRRGCLVEAADRDGRVVFTRWLTWSSVEVLRKRIVIEAAY